MDVKTIDLEETPTSLDDLLALLQNDDEILLTKGSIPLARLQTVSHPAVVSSKRIPGLHAGTTWVSKDFDDPLSDDFWLGDG
jgi:hypothetical protein